MYTVAYIIGCRAEDGAVLVYDDDELISESRMNKYGTRKEDEVQKLTGKKVEVLYFKQKGEEYPDSLEELKSNWKIHK